MTKAALALKLDQLKETIQTERTQVTEAVKTLSTKVDELKAQIANMPEVDLSAEIAAVDAAIAEVQSIMPDPAVDPTEEVVAELPVE